MSPRAEAVEPADYDVPPVTLLFGYYCRIAERQGYRNRARLRAIVQKYSPDLTNLEAGHVTGTLIRGVTVPYDRDGGSLEPGFQYHRDKGLSYFGGSGSDFLNLLDGVVTQGTALCFLDVFGNMISESEK